MFQGCSGVAPGCSGLFRAVPVVFRGVPGCSGLFRAVPGVYRVLQTPHKQFLFPIELMKPEQITARGQ